ncbi:MAG: MalY/PatB family protein [Dermatophilaceae bacterium]
MTEPILDAGEASLRRDRSSVKWRAYSPDVLPLWVAEMDAAPCPAVVEAVTAAMGRGDTGYGWSARYVESFAAFAANRWSWSVDPATARVVADVMIGVSETLRLVTDPGGPVVLSPPVYNAFYDFLDAIGREAVEAPLTSSGRLDLDTLEAAFRAATQAHARVAYLLCSPQNPTGVTHSREELSAVADLAGHYHVQVVADEVHAPLTLPGSPAFVPYLTVPGGQHGISVISPSKGWNLAGLKSAVVVAGEAAMGVLSRLHEVHTHGSSHLGAIAHVAAMDDGGEWQMRLLYELAANRDLLGVLLAEHLPEVGYRPMEATYLAWLDFRAYGLGDDPAEVLRRRGRVALSSGPSFGRTAGRGFARLNIATSPEVLEDAVRRIAAAC